MATSVLQTDVLVDPMPVCRFCVHDHDGPGRSCAAFDRIPDEIWFGPDAHLEPRDGQGNDLTAEIPPLYAESVRHFVDRGVYPKGLLTKIRSL